MSKKETYLGFDCGNSSIRTMVGTYDGSHLKLEAVHQVPNRSLRGFTYDYWDILEIFEQMQRGMKLALDSAGPLSSFGISTWGIDFGLIGPSGEMLANPLCYRNPLGELALKAQSAEDLTCMFNSTGIQNQAMNSVYQLLGLREKLPEFYQGATSLLLIPDLLNYLFTGEKNSEVSIASTTGLVDMRTREYALSVFKKTGIDLSLFPPMVSHGTVRGRLRSAIASRLGVENIPSISVPSHDTASAIVSVPTLEKDFAYISSGTWSLIGTELDEPIISERVQAHGFSNEGGAFGSITLLKNSCGMHILQHIKREIEFAENRKYPWDDLVALAMPDLTEGLFRLFDPNDASLYNPTSMIAAVKTLVGSNNLGLILASAYHSLAVSYKDAIEDLQAITGKTYDAIHIIGGGARNWHLNQMTADISKKKVIAGPEEATSLGIIAIQLMHSHPEMSITDVRSIIKDSVEVVEYLPHAMEGSAYRF